MNIITSLARIGLPLLSLTLLTQAHDHYRSVASGVFAKHELKVTDQSVQAQVSAAHALIAMLDDDLKKKLLFPINSDERKIWTNIGTPSDAKGLRFSDLNPDQVKAALKVLATVLGDGGYDTAIYVPLADDELIPAGEKKPSANGYGVANFTLLIFGEPSVDKPWGIQYDGHHLIYNLTIHGEKMSMSPSFIGTRPSKFVLNGKEIKPIKSLADKGFSLIHLLNDDQKKQAIISKKHFNLRTGAGKDGVLPTPQGLEVSALSDEQKKAVMTLIGEYTSVMPPVVSARRNLELEKELDKMHFAWGGSTEAGKPMSYSLQGPTVIIEYACQGGGEKSLDHIHAMYRDPTNEYGVKFMKP